MHGSVPSHSVLSLVIVAALAIAPVAHGSRPLQTGFLDPNASATERADLMLSVDDASARSKSAGSTFIRLYLYWKRVAVSEPAAPADPDDPAYDWSLLDSQVDAAIAQGLEPILDFRSAPLWAQGPGANAAGTYSPDPAKLADFARAAASRYGGRVRYWEIWNEPNSGHFLRPQRDAQGRYVAARLYRKLVNTAGATLHEVDPSNVVVAGETAPRGALSFVRKLLAGRVEADVFSHHPYSFGSPELHAPAANDVYLADLGEWAHVVRSAVSAGHVISHDGTPLKRVALWVSELSWDTSPPDPAGVPSRLHARWTAEALHRSWQAGARVLIWGQLRDYPLSADRPWGIYQSGLYGWDDIPKISLLAFGFPFVTWARSGYVSVWGRVPPGIVGAVVVERRTASGWRPVRVVAARATGIFASKWRSTSMTGVFRARVGGLTSVPFSLRRPAEHPVSPFGCGGAIAC